MIYLYSLLPLSWYLSLVFGDSKVFPDLNFSFNYFTVFYIFLGFLFIPFTYQYFACFLNAIFRFRSFFLWIFLLFIFFVSPTTFPVYVIFLIFLSSPKSLRATYNIFYLILFLSLPMTLNQLLGIFPELTLFTSLSHIPSLPLLDPVYFQDANVWPPLQQLRPPGAFTTQMHLIPFLLILSLSSFFYPKDKHISHLFYFLLSLSGSVAFLLIPFHYFVFNRKSIHLTSLIFLSFFPFFLRYLLNFKLLSTVFTPAVLFGDLLSRDSSIQFQFMLILPIFSIIIIFITLILVLYNFRLDLDSLFLRLRMIYLFSIFFILSIIGAGLESSTQMSLLFAIITIALFKLTSEEAAPS